MSRMNEPSGQGAAGDIRDTAQQVGQNLRDLGGQVRDAAGEQYDQVKRQAQDYYDQGRERAREFEQNLEEYIQEKPIKSILIAAGVGVVLGLLWKRH